MFYDVIGWVARTLGLEKPQTFEKRQWSECAALGHGNYTRAVSPDELVELAAYRKDERTRAAGGNDPLTVLSAYSQDSLVYSDGKIAQSPSAEAYAQTPHDQRVNKFRQAYKQGAPMMLHKHLADIVVDAAIDMHNQKGWNTVVFDGLRTMEGGYLMYHNAKSQWLADGLLSAPGRSAHNRALAVDSMQFDAAGREVDMGGHFDHENMETNHRNYSGNEITPEAKQNRLIREQAMMRASLQRATVIAPLREEFWDDRVPGSEKDLWRVMESICRCIGQNPPEIRAENYSAFARQWENYLDKAKLQHTFGDYALHPPTPERIVYHECLKPIFDHELPAHMRQSLMGPAKLPATGIRQGI